MENCNVEMENRATFVDHVQARVNSIENYYDMDNSARLKIVLDIMRDCNVEIEDNDDDEKRVTWATYADKMEAIIDSGENFYDMDFNYYDPMFEKLGKWDFVEHSVKRMNEIELQWYLSNDIKTNSIIFRIANLFYDTQSSSKEDYDWLIKEITSVFIDRLNPSPSYTDRDDEWHIHMTLEMLFSGAELEERSHEWKESIMETMASIYNEYQQNIKKTEISN